MSFSLNVGIYYSIPLLLNASVCYEMRVCETHVGQEIYPSIRMEYLHRTKIKINKSSAPR